MNTNRSWAIAIVLFVATVVLGGCSLPLVEGSSSANNAQSSPTPTTPMTPSGAGLAAELESSIALVRPAGEPDEVSGSAVVMSSDGLLVTASEIVSGDIEIVLPDGQVHRPALVTVEPDLGLALLKVPAQRLVPVRFSTVRTSEDAEVFATGYDGSPGSIGRMGGSVTGAVDGDETLPYRVRGPMLIDTDFNLVSGFVGGALSDGDGSFAGVLVSSSDESGEQTTRAVSSWAILGWIESRERHREDLAEASGEWTPIEMPGGWSVRYPDGWNADVSANDASTYRAELMPDDPDASLQLSISVEPNEHGTDAETFIREQFEDRSSATLWGVTRVGGSPLVRLTVVQEGAIIDVAYLLGSEHLIAISMTSGYQTEGDQAQANEARALFEAVIDSLER